MQSVRSLAVAALAAVSLSCADDSLGARRGVRLASLSVEPVFATSPSGGPRIDVQKVRAVLRRLTGLDSVVAQALVQADSAILEFNGVPVTGEETKFNLVVQAFDANDVVVFQGTQEVTVTPGSNAPAAPPLAYTAPDATVASIDIRSGSTSVSSVALQWLGAIPGNTSCLNRVPNASAITQVQLSVNGVNASSQPVPGVRVGWTSLDPTVATVDDNGLVRARCSNKATKVIARTFLDKADTVDIVVTAPPFTLLMSPEVADVRRNATLQMQALVVDENNNSTATTSVTWNSSDTQRATVSASGLVTAIANGRVVITASSTDRTTVGILQVIRPLANRVVASLDNATINVNQRLIVGASAFDARTPEQRILDASGYAWTSTNPSVATVTSTGSVLGVANGTTNIIVALDGKADTVPVTVITSTTGRAAGRVINASNGSGVATASINSAGPPAQADANGYFTSGAMPASGPPAPSMQVSQTGFVSFVYHNLPVQAGTTVEVGELPMAPAGGTGTLTGTVVNSLSDAAVSGATVRLFADVTPDASLPSCSTGCTPLQQVTTTAGGGFTFAGVAAGTYTITVTATGFSFARRITAAVGSQTRDTRIVLSPAPTGSALRVVLTWGDCASPSVPCDLDAHMTGPASAPDTGRFHVAFFRKAYFSSPDSVAVLDNDATTGLGPETVTLRQKAAGTYKYYVHNFTDRADTTSTRLSTTAQARVEIFQGSNLLASFLPPTGQQGTLWAVFQVEGGVIIPINQMLKVQDVLTLGSDFMVMRDADVERIVREMQGRKKR